LACHVRSRLDRYRGDEDGVAARGGRCRAMPDGFKSRKSRAWERLVNELNKSINDAFNTAVALVVVVVFEILVALPTLAHLVPRRPTLVGIEAIRINIVLPCSFSAAVGTSQASVRFRTDTRSAAELSAIAKKRRCSTGSMVRRDAVGLTRGDRGLSVAWRLRTAKSRHGPKPGRHRVAHGRTASLLR
jgi:hypothetical protein